jgi:hypothetical protein
MAPSKGIMEDKDNPAPVFSGETKDWPAFKDAIQLRVDKHDTTWLFEGGRLLAEFFATQIKAKTDEKWLAQPWKIPALQIWAKMYHKYEGMTDMLTGTMMEERANIITYVTGDTRHRRTIYEADQDFERFGKTLIANFKDTSTLWEFLRAILRQCHIHKLSKVGKDGRMGKG